MSAFIETKNSGFLVLTLIKNKEPVILNGKDFLSIEFLSYCCKDSFIINKQDITRKGLESYGYAVVQPFESISNYYRKANKFKNKKVEYKKMNSVFNYKKLEELLFKTRRDVNRISFDLCINKPRLVGIIIGEESPTLNEMILFCCYLGITPDELFKFDSVDTICTMFNIHSSCRTDLDKQKDLIKYKDNAP